MFKVIYMPLKFKKTTAVPQDLHFGDPLQRLASSPGWPKKPRVHNALLMCDYVKTKHIQLHVLATA